MSTNLSREPNWVIRPQDLQARCSTCTEWLPGGVDGLIKHIQREHPEAVPKVKVIHVETGGST